MDKATNVDGVMVSYEKRGSGPPLLLVHGSFSDHRSNWEYVAGVLAERFTTYAIARRGRGETEATTGHAIEDEGKDVVAVLEAIGEPTFLLGHSYGAHVALRAALMAPDRVKKLVLYEPPWPGILSDDAFHALTERVKISDWDGFSREFFQRVLLIPSEEIDALRKTVHWAPIVQDAKHSWGDIQAVAKYRFRANEFEAVKKPVLLQVGSESKGDLYATKALAGVLGHARIDVLEGQAHEGMTTAPEQYARRVMSFLQTAA